MSTRWTFILLVFSLVPCQGQIAINRPIVLTGQSADRKLTGLEDPITENDALNAGVLQAGTYRYAEATGTDALSITFTPPPSLPIAGADFMVRIAAANTGVVTLSVNGYGPYPVVKNAGDDLEPGDLQPGYMADLVFDGTVLHLTNARRLQRRDCPSGFVQVSGQYCIEPLSHDTVQLDVASVSCGLLNARICTWGEWYFACAQAGGLGLQNMGNQWEWTNSTANGVGSARVVGATSCSHAGAGPAFGSAPRYFRCCYDR